MTRKATAEPDLEIAAIGEVYEALKGLDQQAQSRVLKYVAGKLNLESSAPGGESQERRQDDLRDPIPKESVRADDIDSQPELEGVSPIARKWMARNGLDAKQLAKIFSLGSDEIDLISKTVPGDSKKAKVRSVVLLKGVAAYLGGGAARFSHQQIKEACLHYDAYDATNFATQLKAISSEVSGSKDTGYSLTPRGLAAATEVLKSLTATTNKRDD